MDRHRRPGYVFIAAGVGITPIMSMLRTLADRRDLRPLLLFYNGKTWEDLTFREEQAPEGWPGERGRITAEVLARHLPVDRMEYEYFICGPHGMQIAVKKDINRLGLPLENVQSESFNYV